MTDGGAAMPFTPDFEREMRELLGDGWLRGGDGGDRNLEAYAEVQRKINEDIPYIWYDRAQWAVVASNNVRGITNGPLPDGQEANPMGGPGGFGGITFFTQTWFAS